MPRVRVDNLGAVGVLVDPPDHTTPPEAWTATQNMKCSNKVIRRALGHVSGLGTLSAAPSFLFHVPAPNAIFWIYTSLAKAYVYEDGVHTDITRAAGGDYTAANHRDWNGTLLGGIPVLNNGADVPQVWLTLSAATDLTALSNWPATLRAKVIRSFGGYLFALNITESGTNLPHAIRWSNRADPGAVPSSWDYTSAASEAGRIELTDVLGGIILEGAVLGDRLLVYKQNATHAVRYVGGQQIFGTDLLLDSGILAARCVTAFDRGRKHFVVTEDDIVVHAGTKEVDSVVESKVRQTLFAEIDGDNYVNCFVVEDPASREVLFFYPTTGQTIPNKVLIWNYHYNTIDFKNVSAIHGAVGPLVLEGDDITWDADSGTWDADTSSWNPEAQLLGRRRVLVADQAASKVWLWNNGYVFGSTANVSSYAQRTGLAVIGRDRQGQPKVDFESRKLWKRIWPKITGDATVNVRLGAQEEIGGTVNWATPKQFDAAQKYLDFEVVGKACAVEFASTSDASWQLEGYELEVEVLGVL